MYEFEMLDKDTGAVDIFYGYDLDDMKRRYPNIDFSNMVCISRYYID